MPRGPYKRYEYDPDIDIPRSTLHCKRKRQCTINQLQPEPSILNISASKNDGINTVC